MTARMFQSTPPTRAATSVLATYRPAQQFQSTPPTRAATLRTKPFRRQSKFQSTPPTRAATSNRVVSRRDAKVSIHAAHAGGDTKAMCGTKRRPGFNPRRPRGRRPS